MKCHFVSSLLSALLFFFQAEDGIRDTSVTGVQTCALPISHDLGRTATARRPRSCGSPRGTWGCRAPSPRVRCEIGRASCRERVWCSEPGASLEKYANALGPHYPLEIDYSVRGERSRLRPTV